MAVKHRVYQCVVFSVVSMDRYNKVIRSHVSPVTYLIWTQPLTPHPFLDILIHLLMLWRGNCHLWRNQISRSRPASAFISKQSDIRCHLH